MMGEREVQPPSPTTEPASPETTSPSIGPGSPRFSLSGPLPGVIAEDRSDRSPLSLTASDQAFGAPPSGQQSGQPEIASTREAMGKYMTEGMDRANTGPHTLTQGIHYWYNYQSKCKSAGLPGLWEDKYRSGHTRADGFVQPYEHDAFMDWALKPGHSASKALKGWLKGATVAECLSTVVALEIDTLRASIGDARFDQLFGSENEKEDAQVTTANRMHIRADITGTPVANYLHATKLADKVQKRGGQFGSASNEELESELVPGQWYYFYNHPKYLLKHPGGAWQGENALYMGKNKETGERLWSGLGATATEDAMIDEMVEAYGSDRTDYDLKVLRDRGILHDDGSYTDKSYDPSSGTFPDRVTKAEILKAQPFLLDGMTRKGGLLVTSGQELEPDRVTNTRNSR